MGKWASPVSLLTETLKGFLMLYQRLPREGSVRLRRASKSVIEISCSKLLYYLQVWLDVQVSAGAANAHLHAEADKVFCLILILLTIPDTHLHVTEVHSAWI